MISCFLSSLCLFLLVLWAVFHASSWLNSLPFFSLPVRFCSCSVLCPLFSVAVFPPFPFCASLAYFVVLYHLCSLSLLFFVFSFCLSLFCVLFGVSLFFVFFFSLFFLFLSLSLFMIPFYLRSVLSRFVLIFVFAENVLKWRQNMPFKQKLLINYNMDTLLKPKPPTKPANQLTGISRPSCIFLGIWAARRALWLNAQHLNPVLSHSPLSGAQSINPSKLYHWPMKTWVQNNQSEVSGYAAAMSKNVYFGLQYGIHTISMSQVFPFLLCWGV